jgi:hypothetical protein
MQQTESIIGSHLLLPGISNKLKNTSIFKSHKQKIGHLSSKDIDERLGHKICADLIRQNTVTTNMKGNVPNMITICDPAAD